MPDYMTEYFELMRHLILRELYMYFMEENNYEAN